MKKNLVINPSDTFIKTNNEYVNLFVDRYVYDQCKIKNSSDQFLSSRLDSNYRSQNFNLSNLLFYEILKCLKTELNLVFDKKFNSDFYEITLGVWLRKFIEQFIFKYQNIIEANKIHDIQTATIYDTDEFSFFTSETDKIYPATLNNLWNACIYSYILKNLNLTIKFKLIKPHEKNLDDKNVLLRRSFSSKNFKQSIINIYSYLINFIPNYSKIFMYNTGFQVFTEKKIDLMFGQIPRIYPNRFQFNYSNYDKNLRDKFNFEKFIKINNKKYNQNFVEIFNLIIRILYKSLPLFIVEDFNNLIKFSRKLNFPKNPKAICTSYAFQTNEPFKFYLALKKFFNPKIKYFVYQHGGSYITRLDNSFNNECNTCDYFITWGDKTDLTKKNNIKFVNFKLVNKKYFKNQNRDTFLIITRSLGYNVVPYDRYSEGINEMNILINLCNKFSNEIKQKTIIRAHYSAKYKKDQFKQIEGIKIDYAEQNYFKAINNTKLILFNHDSTGMLEMLALNKPTLCIWGKGNQHQNSFVLEDYELLKKAEILFDDHNKLYEHLIKIWNDPLKWWYSDKVQKNLNEFVNFYTKKPDKNFANNFKKIIIDRI